MTDLTSFPSHAAAIYIGAKGELRLGLPPSDGHSTSHSIELKPDARGMAQLIQILSARLQTSVEKARIGVKAVPTQALADAIARSPKLAEHEAQKRERERVAGLSTTELLDEYLSDSTIEDLLSR